MAALFRPGLQKGFPLLRQLCYTDCVRACRTGGNFLLARAETQVRLCRTATINTKPSCPTPCSSALAPSAASCWCFSWCAFTRAASPRRTTALPISSRRRPICSSRSSASASRTAYSASPWTTPSSGAIFSPSACIRSWRAPCCSWPFCRCWGSSRSLTGSSG